MKSINSREIQNLTAIAVTCPELLWVQDAIRLGLQRGFGLTGGPPTPRRSSAPVQRAQKRTRKAQQPSESSRYAPTAGRWTHAQPLQVAYPPTYAEDGSLRLGVPAPTGLEQISTSTPKTASDLDRDSE